MGRMGPMLNRVALAAFLFGAGAAAARPLPSVNDWLYVLQLDQGVTPAAIAASSFDGVVMDYASDGSGETEFSASDIAAIRASGKIVLAYLSIGEAEAVRFYWNPAWADQPAPDPDAPPWLGPFNPDFPDNYKVRYWDPAWQDIIFGTPSGPAKSFLDRVLDQGFDGVYLDIIDGFEFWSAEVPERTRLQARTDMVQFVSALADYARTTRGRPDFLVLPQNGATIILDDNEELDTLGQSWLSIVDGIGAEDTFYNELTAQPQDEVAYTTALLDTFRTHPGRRRIVLAVDYVWNAQNPAGSSNVNRYNDFESRCLSRGYIPYAAVRDRALDEILAVTSGGGFAEPQPKPDVPAGTGWAAR
ncbi:endo alpha-1,4 polygalactosaminidase [Candidatus Poribacteria bacterium]|nr:endo alpha-1,4 polygalactosaminidase [Candidatus Poribacteria bacterium]